MAIMSLKEQVARFKASLGKKLLIAGLGVEAKMHELVAVDTGALDKSIKTDDVIDRGRFLSLDIGSEGVHYAVYVDQGVKKKVFNYHKRSGASRPIIYTGFGQRWVSRSLEAQKEKIAATLREARISR